MDERAAYIFGTYLYLIALVSIAAYCNDWRSAFAVVILVTHSISFGMRMKRWGHD